MFFYFFNKGYQDAHKKKATEYKVIIDKKKHKVNALKIDKKANKEEQ